MTIARELKIFSGIAAILAVLHMIWPTLGIDAISITLLLIASIPWLVPYLSSIELPGGVKIELHDAKKATESIPESLEEEEDAKEEAEIVSDLSKIAQNDSNLAIVGFRIEVDKKLYRAAELNGITVQSKSLSSVVEELRNARVLPDNLARDLGEIIQLGDKAAHGVPVSKDAAAYILKKGPAILKRIDVHFRF